jgi:putative CocE/NonD family hydrolase
VVKNALIPVEGGVRLACDLYFPEVADGPLPAVMDYIPYRKDDVRPGELFYERLASLGYVVARVDCRGTGASGGFTTDEYSALEQRDGRDAVEWLAAQSWCDGHVSMIGISYGGFTALQVAAMAPTHLTSVIPVDFTDDRYSDDCHYWGGTMRMYYDAGHYGNVMVAANALPPAPEWSDESWAGVWKEHLERNQPYLLQWLRNQTDGPYWRNGSVGDVAERIRCPVFMIGGWRDGYTNPPFRLWEKLQVPRKLLIGPWDHNYPDRGTPGPRIDFVIDVVRWLDHWCKGRETGIMDEPPIVVYMQRWDKPAPDRLESSGTWRAETCWPVAAGSERRLHLAEAGQLGNAHGPDGLDEIEYEPTVGITGGLWSAGVPFGLAGDQRRDEAFSLVYTSPPLEDDLPILGRPRAHLHVSSSAAVVAFTVGLSEVVPDGTSQLVCKGMLNATRRTSFVEPAPLTPGEVVELEILLPATGWTFTKGNRIRVAVANADFPNVWPTPEPAISQVYRGMKTPSYVSLPVVLAEGGAAPPRFPAAATGAAGLARKSPPVWEVATDVLSGRTRVRGEYEIRAGDHVEFACEVDPNDPADASASGSSRLLRQTANGMVEAESSVHIQGTPSHFNAAVELTVRTDGAVHFTRRWTESVERRLL